MTSVYIIGYVIIVTLTLIVLCVSHVLINRAPREKRKNDEKHKNNAFGFHLPISYEDLINGHELERKMMAYRHQNELIELEHKQQEQMVMWINYHATPQLFIEPVKSDMIYE